ncbi:MAG: nuclear transport factor 2 family protein, partial [Pseudomonadota bacterium]
MSVASSYPKILGLMARYFDGLYHCDSDTLRTVFHDKLSYVNATVGNHEFMGIEAYMTRIDNRLSPASRGDVRNEAIDSITLNGSQMAFVEARMTMLGRDYHDLLTLVHEGTEWKVVTKV